WAAQYRLVAISNGNADLDRIGLGKLFSASLSAQDLDFAKPDPRIFLKACSQVGIEPARVLHVGDDLRLDVLAARQAGLQSAWLRRADIDAGSAPSSDAELPRSFGDLH
ncbi:MAG: HAD family hydrolase, partial [Quisquiliibacterium sp.]